ncbi:MAG: tRNA (adenosine(37)-N6)-threonylcarbamoyltransferase complex ATPase subunit type 1 TsaE [candidate division NC10 bacterium]|nr:tRNA (adenosine(37)-N6)-threonylcarbamoyltransferase complex ATPase subunit type 1 TsaE [candidate division NC10 bacterium]
MTVLNLADCAFLWESSCPEETVRMGEELGRLLCPGDVVALCGDLGSGKTVLTRGIAQGLGCPGQEVHSPSFTLVNEYQGGRDGQRPLRLAHVDLYRIQSETEVPGLGWDEYVSDPYVTVVEWAERAPSFLPRDVLRITLTAPDAARRLLSVQSTGPRSERLAREWLGRAGRPATLG